MSASLSHAAFQEVRLPRPIHSSAYLSSRSKRALDVAGSLALLVFLLPLFAIIAAAIKVSSPGPVFFRQRRGGVAMVPFRIYKFRSMYSREEEVDVPQATRNDPRVTPVGRILRRTSIDELPQLINVLQGDMSLVGPRPHAVAHDAYYSRKVELYSHRFQARPGLTGLAQVNGARGETPRTEDMRWRIGLDVRYIAAASLIVDLSILLKTFLEVLRSPARYDSAQANEVDLARPHRPAPTVVPDSIVSSFTAGFPVGAVWVNVLNPGDLINHLRRNVLSGKGAATATLNLDHLAQLRSDAAFRAAYAVQDLITADGFPIVLAGRLQGVDVERTAGSDLVNPIADLAAELGCGLALVGSSEDSLAKAAAELKVGRPKLAIALRLSPVFGFDPTGPEADRIASKLAQSGARLCLVALGAPKQEIFAARLRTLVPGLCVISIGAGLDFISGHQTRAPQLFRKLNLEWAWRLFGDPRRLAGRYARSAITLPQLVLDTLALGKPVGRGSS